jgi:hypothetical protein
MDEDSEIQSLREQAERLAARNTELERELHQEQRRYAALSVDADRREQRALRLLPDFQAHRGEIQYLRHMTSWYWNQAQSADEARHAITGPLQATAIRLCAGTDATVKATDVAGWLDRAIDQEKKPLSRKGYRALADCLREGGCDHDGLSEQVKADIILVLGLTGGR